MSSRRRAYVNNHEIYGLDEAMAVDFLGRYETLQEDLDKALKAAGVEQRIEIPQVNVTPNKDEARDYRSYYSDEMREMIAEWYAPEIKLLGYEF
jgi:F420-dependent methylenetetrahydromethanopterin dehydrogenase